MLSPMEFPKDMHLGGGESEEVVSKQELASQQTLWGEVGRPFPWMLLISMVSEPQCSSFLQEP